MTIPLPPTNAIISPVVGQPITVLNPSAVAVGGTVVSANGKPATMGGQKISLDQVAGIIIDKTPGAAAPIAVAGNAVLANFDNVVVAESPLSPGAPAITIGGTSVSLAPSGTLVVGSSSINMSPQQTCPSQLAEFVVGGETFTAAPSASAIALAGTTITPGGPGVAISRNPISIAASGVLMIGAPSIPFTSPAILPQPSVYTVGDQTFTANPTAIPIPCTILTPGGPALTISGTPISLAPSGTLIIGTSSIHLPAPNASIFTVGSQTFTVTDLSAVPTASINLTPSGAAVTVDGTAVSLALGGTLVNGGSSVVIPSKTGSAGVVPFEGAGIGRSRG
ncbi:MAG: hypothetical protein Q9164_002090, partial [Protoblastenia rupestris]